MSWNEQADSMMKVWTEAQRKMWENWYDLAQAVPSPTLMPTNVLEQWSKMSSQAGESWMAGSQAVSSNIYRQLLSGQNAMMRFLELSTHAWKAMAPKLEAGEDWQAVLSEYTEKLRRQLMPDPTAMVQMSKDVNELWGIYLGEIQGLMRPWMEPLVRAPGHLGGAFAGGNTSELVELTSLYWDAYERTFGRLVESPSMGFTRELNEKLFSGFDAWQDFRRVSIEYQGVLANGWVRIFEEMMRDSIEFAEKGKPITSLRDLIRLWTGTSDRVLGEIFVSEEYIKAQGRLFSATMTYRLREQEVVETFLKPGYIPTRSEVDEVHRNIYELRKEVKALKKALNEAQRGNGAKSPVADLRKEINALKKALKEVQESNGKAPAQAEQQVESGD